MRERQRVRPTGGPAGRRGIAWRVLALVLPPLAVLTGCTIGPSVRPPIAIRGAESAPPAATSTTEHPNPVPPLGGPGDATISWADCTTGTAAAIGVPAQPGLPFACSKISAVLDPPGTPGRGTVRLAALKAGTGPTPLVVVNDTTGEPGTLFAARLATRLPADFLKTFSLVAIDRRGTGGSSPTNCVPQQARDTMTGFDPGAVDEDALSKLLDAARTATQECSMALDKRVVAYDSWRSAADLDTLRTALGVPRLNALGHGTGSAVLTTYRSRFPDRVGRMVLDGAPDPKLDDVAQQQVRAEAAEATLTAFAATCAARAGCPLDSNPAAGLARLAAQLTAHPARTADGHLVDGGVLYEAVLSTLVNPGSWSALADALITVNAGDATGIAALAQPVTTGATGAGQLNQPPRFDAQLTSECNDTTTRVPLERAVALSAEWKAKYPAFGAYFAHRLVICAPWPTAAQGLPLPSDAGAPAMVLLTNTDPVTPAVSTERMAAQLGARLVRWQGAGHGAFPDSVCATATAQRYLVDGQLPTADTICPP